MVHDAAEREKGVEKVSWKKRIGAVGDLVQILRIDKEDRLSG